jgi:hypothetical protein
VTEAGPDPRGSRRAAVRTLRLYLAAFVVYVVVGVLVPEFMFTSVVGIAYVLVAVWIVPSLLARLR